MERSRPAAMRTTGTPRVALIRLPRRTATSGPERVARSLHLSSVPRARSGERRPQLPRRCNNRGLEPEPVVALDQEDVRGGSAEQRPDIVPKVDRAPPEARLAAARPYEKERRTGVILPPEHRVTTQRTGREVLLRDEEAGRRTGAVGVDRITARHGRGGAHIHAVDQLPQAAGGREFLEARVAPARDGRLHGQLKGEGRRERHVEARVHAHLALR